jgi:hypothetical protein
MIERDGVDPKLKRAEKIQPETVLDRKWWEVLEYMMAFIQPIGMVIRF